MRPRAGLPTCPTRTENLAGFSVDDCLRGWELEFMVEDVNLYSVLARAPTPAAGLRQVTGDSPARSARYREVMRPRGLEDELRAVLRADGSPWAVLALYRAEGAPAFDSADRALVAELAEPLGVAVREHARPASRAAARPDPNGPGLMVFAPNGELATVNDDARASNRSPG